MLLKMLWRLVALRMGAQSLGLGDRAQGHTRYPAVRRKRQKAESLRLQKNTSGNDA